MNRRAAGQSAIVDILQPTGRDVGIAGRSADGLLAIRADVVSLAMPALWTIWWPPLLMVVSLALPATDCIPEELIVVRLAEPPLEMFWVPLLMTVLVAMPPFKTVCRPALLIVVSLAEPAEMTVCVPPLMVVALARPPGLDGLAACRADIAFIGSPTTGNELPATGIDGGVVGNAPIVDVLGRTGIQNRCVGGAFNGLRAPVNRRVRGDAASADPLCP